MSMQEVADILLAAILSIAVYNLLRLFGSSKRGG